MKNVMGGVAPRPVTCFAMPGYTIEQPGSCIGSQSGCQAAANSWCSAAGNHCNGCIVG